MAAVVANGPAPFPMVPRGRGTNIGTLPVSTNNVVSFTVSQLVGNPNGFDDLLIFCTGGTVGTPVLEGSVDGGNTWFTITASGASSSATQVSAAANAATGDTAVTSANSYIIAGLQGLCLFRFNAAVTVSPAVVWVACS